MFVSETIGERFGIIAKLGGGSEYNQTFLAEDLFLPEKPKCIVKQLKMSSKDASYVEAVRGLFTHHAQLLCRLGEHPQIPTLIAYFEIDGKFYIVQEYIEGQTLEAQLLSGKNFTQTEIVKLVQDLLRLLAFVHAQGVVHQKVKPSNIISQTADGKLVLINFDSVTPLGQQSFEPPRAPDLMTIESRAYAAPEQLAGQARPASDLYSAGMTAIRLLTRVQPANLVHDQKTGEWVWQNAAHISPQLSRLLNRLIKLDFRQRFSGAVEVLEAFQEVGFFVSNTPVASQNQFRQAPCQTSSANQAQHPAAAHSGQPAQTSNTINPSAVQHLTALSKTTKPTLLASVNELINGSVFYKTIMYLIVIGIILWFCTWLVLQTADVQSYQLSR